MHPPLTINRLCAYYIFSMLVDNNGRYACDWDFGTHAIFHIPSSSQNLKSYLLKRHLFCSSIFCTPRSFYSFVWHKMDHLTNLYFFLCCSFCQKNKRYMCNIVGLFNNPFGIFKKDNMNMGKIWQNLLTLAYPHMIGVHPSDCLIFPQSYLPSFSIFVAQFLKRSWKFPSSETGKNHYYNSKVVNNGPDILFLVQNRRPHFCGLILRHDNLFKGTKQQLYVFFACSVIS